MRKALILVSAVALFCMGCNTTNTRNKQTAFELAGVNAEKIYTSGNRTLVLDNMNTLWIFGEATNYFLDINSNENLYEAIPIATDVVDAVVASSSILVKKKDNSLWGCFLLSIGEIERSNEFVHIMDNVKSFATWSDVIGIVQTDGSAWAVGRNFRGKMGIGTVKDDNVVYKEPQQMLTENGPVRDAVEIAVGYESITVLDINGVVWGSGILSRYYGGPDNYFTAGEAGIKTLSSGITGHATGITNSNKAVFIYADDDQTYSLGDGIVAIASRGWHSILLNEHGEVYVIGQNDSYSLGKSVERGKKLSSLTKFEIKKDKQSIFIEQVSTDSWSTIFLDSEGNVWGVGNNESGQLGLTDEILQFPQILKF